MKLTRRALLFGLLTAPLSSAKAEGIDLRIRGSGGNTNALVAQLTSQITEGYTDHVGGGGGGGRGL